MASAATEQPPRDDRHRFGVPIMPRPGHRPKDHRQCLKCRFFKPLQDFAAWRKKGQYVTRCVACRKEMQSSSRALQVSGTKRGFKTSIGEVDGPQKPRRYVPIAAKPPPPSFEPPQEHCTPTPRYVPFAAHPSRVSLITTHTAPFQTRKPHAYGTPHRVILPRNVAAAGHASQDSLFFQGRGLRPEDTPVMHPTPHRVILPRSVDAAGHASQGSSVFQGRGVRPGDTPVMHLARQDRGFTSRAQPFEAHHGSVPSPSQNTTTAGQDAMTTGPKSTTAGPKAATAEQKTTTAGQKTTTAGQDAMTTESKTMTTGPKSTIVGQKATTAGHDARTARAICHLSRENEEISLADRRIKTEK
ncbi:hypothetical protein E4U56_003361 [Claviceps arundinis]|uniref:Uncharacterized protein n=1 Tax=Claviceps arundinis TaxID=1623583 RepID=A0A9P7N0B6_9HYPO|nr:hypothetical protein E4U56_003361 [Claviceps arundinis]